MSYWEDKGCLMYGLFFLWMGVLLGLPHLIFGVEEITYGAIAGLSAAYMSIPAYCHAKEGTIRRDYPFTFSHLCAVFVYAIVTMMVIGFKDMSYEDMRSLGQSLLCYIPLPIIVFIIEYCIKEKEEKRFIDALSVGYIFEEEESRESIRTNVYRTDIEIVGRAIWRIVEISGNEIKLQDVHHKRRTKTVKAEELKKYKWENGVSWYRDPSYYECLVEAIRDREKQEYYGEDEE